MKENKYFVTKKTKSNLFHLSHEKKRIWKVKITTEAPVRVLYLSIQQFLEIVFDVLFCQTVSSECQSNCLITIEIDKLDTKHKKCHTIGKFPGKIN